MLFLSLQIYTLVQAKMPGFIISNSVRDIKLKLFSTFVSLQNISNNWFLYFLFNDKLKMDLDYQQRLRDGLRDGNKEIFEEIYKTYYSPLCFYCMRYVDDMEDSREIVQGLFLKIWIKRKELKISTSVKSYLFSSVQNYALNYIKREKIKQRYINNKSHHQVQHSENGIHKMEEEELRVLIKSAILKLPKKRREIFELSRYENLKYSQIAEQLTISVKTVEAQMSKSLIFLRQVLKEYIPVILLQLIWVFNFWK